MHIHRTELVVAFLDASLTQDGSVNQGITLGGEGGNETYDGEFNSRGGSVWDE